MKTGQNRDSRRIKDANKRAYTKSNSSKNMRRDKEIADTAARELSKTNDYSWYAKFPQFTKDAGTLAFGIPLGQIIDLTATDKVTIPGIMKICFIPGCGYSDSLMSPVNRMALKFYTYLRDVQKAAAKYDSADIMMYLMAIDSLMSFHSLMRRAYGVAQLYTPVNKYYPRQLLQFMGFDPSIADNLAEFRAYINRYALALGSYCMPKSFDITVRHKWMCEGVYLDSNSTRAQSYVFVPEGFWQFDNTVSTGSQLSLVRWQNAGDTHTLHTLQQVQNFGNALINAILGDQDTGNISGDLFAAFKPEGLMKLEETPEQYALMPVYNETVLSQIENATMCGEVVGTPTITQNPSVNNGAIIYTPSFDNGALSGTVQNTFLPSMGDYATINIHGDSPTPEQVIEATRLTACYTSAPPSEDAAQFFVNVFGSDIVTRCWVGLMSSATPGAMSSIYVKANKLKEGNTESVGSLTARMELLALFTAYDWAPQLWLAKPGSNALDVTFPAFDVDNITKVSATQLSMMHEASLLSMLDVPQMGM